MIFASAARQDEAALEPAHTPAVVIGTLGKRCFPSSSAWPWAKLQGA